jgi:hypothetical protein
LALAVLRALPVRRGSTPKSWLYESAAAIVPVAAALRVTVPSAAAWVR